MSDDYNEKHFGLVLAAIASGLAAPEAVDKADRVMALLGYTK